VRLPRDWNLDPFANESLRQRVVPTLSLVTEPLEVAAWQVAVGRLASEDLPEIATEALVRGLDSPALRVLAGQARWDVRDSSDLFRVALDELGIELPDTDRAQWHLARRTAGEIVAGRIRAALGAVADTALTAQQQRCAGTR
jgi:hypothetical protein